MTRANSLYLDLMRFAAAMAVFFFHASGQRLSGGLFWQVGHMGQEAVVVFFVLSGFVIAYSCEAKHRDLSDYLVARLARLWSVVLPALLLTVILDAIGRGYMSGGRHLYGNIVPSAAGVVLQFVLNAFFVSEVWFAEIMPGTDDAFWSLPFEFWYYIIFGLVYFTRGRRRTALVLLGMVIVGPRILLLFPIWLAGVAAYNLTRSGRIGPWLGWILWLGSFVSLVLFKHEEIPLRRAFEIAMLGGPDLYADPVRMFWPLSWILGAIVAANIIGFNAVGQRFERPLYFFSAPIRFLAGMTFAIYLFHYPLIIFFSTVTRETTVGATTMVAVFIGTPAVIVPLSLGCDRFKRWLTTVLQRVVALLWPISGADPHTSSVAGTRSDIVERHTI